MIISLQYIIFNFGNKKFENDKEKKLSCHTVVKISDLDSLSFEEHLSKVLDKMLKIVILSIFVNFSFGIKKQF
jgi:hypothetical protein